ncbi:hypothetical protein A2U01_0081951 [Trifolium medium]|uniref:Uncharacterized protein n=1 Tax=Trifolium medium TaxID=97028 RepID=A0A392TL87_9FABA|nr:hypothetical protein [Trifolium medium]
MTSRVMENESNLVANHFATFVDLKALSINLEASVLLSRFKHFHGPVWKDFLDNKGTGPTGLEFIRKQLQL